MKQIKKKHKKLVATNPILYDQTDFVELCDIMVAKAAQVFITMPQEFFQDMDIVFMAQVLQNNFDRETLFEMIESDFGQGVIFGMYLNEKARADEEADQQSSDEEATI
jgi:hypothetical protein